MVSREFVFYFFLYAVISVIYRCALTEPQKLYLISKVYLTFEAKLFDPNSRVFESAALICQKYIKMIPVTFIMGFYVSIVFTRWQGILGALPWIDSYANYFSLYFKIELTQICICRPAVFLCFLVGSDAKSKLYRRSIAR